MEQENNELTQEQYEEFISNKKKLKVRFPLWNQDKVNLFAMKMLKGS